MADFDKLQAAKVHVLGTLIECILYGGFVVLTSITLVSTFRRTVTPQVIRIHVFGLTMLCLSSIHVISNICRLIRGLGTGGGILEEYSSPTFLLRQAISVLQLILGDASWLYRLHVVWEGTKRVTYPFLLVLISTIGIGAYATINIGETPATAGRFVPSEPQHAATATVALALASSIGVTALIAFRVGYVNRRVKEHIYSSGVGQTRNILQDFVVLVIESGAIYTAFLLVFLVSLVYDSSVSAIPNQVIIQVVGIVYYMMLFQSTLPRGNRYPQTHTETRNGIARQVEDIELSALEAPRPVVVHVTKWETRQEDAV